MPLTNAEKQRNWRERHARVIGDLRGEVATLNAALDERGRQLEAAQDEIDRLTLVACKHPAAAVDGGTCRACGADVW